VLALDIVAYLQRIDGHWSTIGLSLDCGLLAATLVTFAYSIVTYRRLLKYEDYHLTADAKAHSFVPGGTAAAELGYDKLGHQTSGITTTTTTELRYSHRHSYQPPAPAPAPAPAPSYIRPYPGPTTTSSPHPPPPGPAAGTEEERTKALRNEVDRAISVEFGWSTPPPSFHAHNNNNTHDSASASSNDGVSRSSSVVLGGGMVHVHHGAGLVAVPEEGGGVQRVGSFVAVAEGGDEGVDFRSGRRGEEGGEDDDREALLPRR
jgi:hypothetical protein